MKRRARSSDNGPVRQRVGPTIKLLRHQSGLSLNALADQAGISPSHLSRMERGLTVPSYDVLDRVADALGSDLRTLRAEEEAARAIDDELDRILVALSLDPDVSAELMRLSHRCREELTKALRRVVSVSG